MLFDSSSFLVAIGLTAVSSLVQVVSLSIAQATIAVAKSCVHRLPLLHTLGPLFTDTPNANSYEPHLIWTASGSGVDLSSFKHEVCRGIIIIRLCLLISGAYIATTTECECCRYLATCSTGVAYLRSTSSDSKLTMRAYRPCLYQSQQATSRRIECMREVQLHHQTITHWNLYDSDCGKCGYSGLYPTSDFSATRLGYGNTPLSNSSWTDTNK
ncbi:hypothetical protein KCV07_g233, partial [Aureobasidium melanogenum]